MHTLAVLMSFLHRDWRGHNLSRCCFKTPGPSLNVGNVSSRRQSTLPKFFFFSSTNQQRWWSFILFFGVLVVCEILLSTFPAKQGLQIGDPPESLRSFSEGDGWMTRKEKKNSNPTIVGPRRGLVWCS